MIHYLHIHVRPGSSCWSQQVYTMPISSKPEPDTNLSVDYQIRVEGHLDHQWAGWFEGMTLTLEENGETLITGPVIDQAALFGLLKKVRDLGIPLVSVNPAKSAKTGGSEGKR